MVTLMNMLIQKRVFFESISLVGRKVWKEVKWEFNQGNLQVVSLVIQKMDCLAWRSVKVSGTEWVKNRVGDGTLVGDRIQPFTAICWLSSLWRVCAGLLFTGARECSRACFSPYGRETWTLGKRKNFTCVSWLVCVLWNSKVLVINWQTVTVSKTLNTKMVCLQKVKKKETSQKENMRLIVDKPKLK